MTSGTHWKRCETRVQRQQLLLCLPYKSFYIFLIIIFTYFSQVLKHKNIETKCDQNKGLMNTKEAMCCAVLSHCSLPGSSVHGIFQARILEWVALPFSRGSSQHRIKPGSPALQADSLPFELPGKPFSAGKQSLKIFFPLNLNLILLMNNVLEITFSV